MLKNFNVITQLFFPENCQYKWLTMNGSHKHYICKQYTIQKSISKLCILHLYKKLNFI